MKTVILHGILAKKFGKTFKLSVNSTKEAMRALCVQLTGFEAFMMNAHKQGLRFAVFHDKHNVGENELDMNHTAKIIRVVPVVEGSKKEGVLETVIGAVLVVAGVRVTGWCINSLPLWLKQLHLTKLGQQVSNLNPTLKTMHQPPQIS